MHETARLGLFGGSFDPVHNGHLKIASLARRQFKLDKIYFIPAFSPPHKRHRKLTAFKHRLKMLSLALKDHPDLKISYYEINQKKVTYTYQTVGYYKKLFPGTDFYFIFGSDSLRDFGTWKKKAYLLKNCRFIVGKRPGVKFSVDKKVAKCFRFISRSISPVSSSEVRQRVKNGLSITNLVPKDVEEYIYKNGLYLQE
jgi:nicotinate-nucleotide adenylyltransferase